MNGRMFRNLIFFKFVGNPNNRFIIFFLKYPRLYYNFCRDSVIIKKIKY